jgi:hypothetical protein
MSTLGCPLRISIFKDGSWREWLQQSFSQSLHLLTNRQETHRHTSPLVGTRCRAKWNERSRSLIQSQMSHAWGVQSFQSDPPLEGWENCRSLLPYWTIDRRPSHCTPTRTVTHLFYRWLVYQEHRIRIMTHSTLDEFELQKFGKGFLHFGSIVSGIPSWGSESVQWEGIHYHGE